MTDFLPPAERSVASTWVAVGVAAPGHGKKSLAPPSRPDLNFLLQGDVGVGGTKDQFFSSFYLGWGLSAASSHASWTPSSLLSIAEEF